MAVYHSDIVLFKGFINNNLHLGFPWKWLLYRHPYLERRCFQWLIKANYFFDVKGRIVRCCLKYVWLMLKVIIRFWINKRNASCAYSRFFKVLILSIPLRWRARLPIPMSDCSNTASSSLPYKALWKMIYFSNWCLATSFYSCPPVREPRSLRYWDILYNHECPYVYDSNLPCRL